MKEPVLVLGATSAIARAVATELARHGHPLILGARELDDVSRTARDLSLRYGIAVRATRFDALDEGTHRDAVDALAEEGSGPAGVVLCHGELGEQERAFADWRLARHILEVNFVSAVSVLNRAALLLESRGGGFLCAVSSVAGDRGRQSNFLYGSAKGGLSIYLGGLRNRMFRSGVSVIDVKPGFIDTAMTFGLPKLFLVASPARAARDIHRAISRRRFVIYTPWFWRWILLIIRTIPERVFVRMKL